MNYSRIQAIDLLSQKIPYLCILDVRTTAEINAENLPESLKIPLHELNPERLTAEIKKYGVDGSSIYLFCQSGKRAEMAAEQIYGQINAKLYVIEGGVSSMKQAGFVLQSNGKTVMSLERQVRIAAGFLVLCGVLLGAFASNGFYLLSGFVGAGLMFAGITDTCMMGMLLARMPWNK